MTLFLNEGEKMLQTAWNVHSINDEVRQSTIVLKPSWHENEKNLEKPYFFKRVEVVTDIVDVTNGYKYLIQPCDSIIVTSSNNCQIMQQSAISTYKNTKYIYTLMKEQELTEDTHFTLHLKYSTSYRVVQVTAQVVCQNNELTSVESITNKIKQLEKNQTECLKKLLECTLQLSSNTEKLSKANLELQDCIAKETQAQENDAKNKLEKIKLLFNNK